MQPRKQRVLILNDGRDCGAPYAPLFKHLGEITHDVATFKLQPLTFRLLVFTGGSDVSPDLYGDTSPNNWCHSNPKRDAEEHDVFKFARQRGVRMVGICRGMQFLNVMTGGKIMHDINGHGSGSHETMTKDRDEPFMTNSFHHQMCIPHKDTQILAWSHKKLSKSYIGDKDRPIDYKGPEVEAIYNSIDKIIGVQWHPEATPDSGKWIAATNWFRHLVKDYIDVDVLKFKRLYLGMEGARVSVREAH